MGNRELPFDTELFKYERVMWLVAIGLIYLIILPTHTERRVDAASVL